MSWPEPEAAVHIEVADVAGSAPREIGAAMCVSSTGLLGTIGGGALEFRAIEHARELLAGADVPASLELPLGPALGQCCGGRVRLEFRLCRFEMPNAGQKTEVHIYGGGHVGRALAQALIPLAFEITVHDIRPDVQSDLKQIGIRTVADYSPPISHSAFHLVMTHQHAIDLEITARILLSGSFAFVGLIGSATKRARFERDLKARGVSPDILERLICPIGIAGIMGKEPATIAASATAQLLIAAEALQNIDRASRA